MKVILFIILISSLLGCQEENSKTATNKKTDHDISVPIQDFAFKLLKTQKDDFFISPLGIFTTLFMTATGAKDKTYEEFNNLLFHGFKFSLENKVKTFSALAKQLQTSKDLEFYSSVWVHQNFPMNPQYMDLLKTYFMIEGHNVNFGKESTRIQINEDVANKTHQKIKDLLPQDSVDSLTRVVLINTLYFLSNWDKQFDPRRTRKHKFFSYNKKVVNVPFMFKELKLRYTSDENVTHIDIPYSNKRYSMQIFLPKQGAEKEFFNSFNREQFDKIRSKAQEKKVLLYLPKWKSDFFLKLKPLLQALGLKRAFNEQEAEFYKMSLKKKLYITDALHKTFLDVSEKGTEAAAATAIVMGIKSMRAPSPRVRVDHPFLFTIFDNHAKVILFMGVQSFSNK